MTPQLWKSPIYINILMDLENFPEFLGQFGLKMAWLCQKQTKQAYKIAKFMCRLVTPKAKGSYFGPKHLEQITLSDIHFIENAQAKPRQHFITILLIIPIVLC